MSKGVFRRPHFAPRYRRPVYLPSATAAAAPSSLPLRPSPIKALLAGTVFRRAYVAPTYRRRAFLPSLTPAPAPASLPLRIYPVKRLLGGPLFRRPPFAPTYRGRAWLPSVTPAAAPLSLPLRISPMRRLLAGEVFRRPHFAPAYRRLAFLPSLAPAAPVSRPPPVRRRRAWLLAHPGVPSYYRQRRGFLPGAARAPLGALSVFFTDFAVTASFGAQSTQVLRDAPDLELLGDAVLSREYAITYAASQLTGLKTGDTVTVDGVAYKVREVTSFDDGALMRATLTKP